MKLLNFTKFITVASALLLSSPISAQDFNAAKKALVATAQSAGKACLTHLEGGDYITAIKQAGFKQKRNNGRFARFERSLPGTHKSIWGVQNGLVSVEFSKKPRKNVLKCAVELEKYRNFENNVIYRQLQTLPLKNGYKIARAGSKTVYLKNGRQLTFDGSHGSGVARMNLRITPPK